MQRAGRLHDAERLYRDAIAVQPGHVDAKRGLALVLRQMNRLPEAIQVLQALAAEHPTNPAVHAELGLALHAAGRAEEAVASLKETARLDPKNAAAYLHLGRAQLADFDADGAIQSLHRAFALAPRSAEVAMSLGVAYLHRGTVDRAIRFLREALPERDSSAELHTYLGTALRLKGELDAAVEHFRRALALRAGLPEAAAGLAQALEDRREFVEAARVIADALAAGADHPELYVALARHAQREGRAEEARQRLEDRLSRPVLYPQHRAGLLFALGSVRESLKDFDGAFAAYREANAQYPRTYNRPREAAFHDRVIEVFSAERMRTLPRAQERSDLPVFIVGMPRSGTSLVEQILASHPAVYGAGELNDIKVLSRAVASRLGRPESGGGEAYPRSVLALTQAVADELAREHIERLSRLSAGAERITDKMPHNFIHLGLINLLFPGARVIHCVRDPMDTCFSCFATSFSQAHSYSNDLGDLAFQYREYRRLMQHWRRVLDIPMMDVHYERLVADREGVTRAMIEFLGLPWHDACLRHHETRRTVATASVDQARRPVYDSSIGRAARFEKHLQTLRIGLADLAPGDA